MKKKWLLPLLRRRFLVGVLVVAQAALFVYFLLSTSRISSLVANSFTAISVLVALFVLSGRGESSYKLTWIFVILCFPVVGGLLYLSFDQHVLRHALIKKAKSAEKKTRPLMAMANGVTINDAAFPKTVRYLSYFAGFPAYLNSESVFLASGEEMFFRLKEELLKAERYVFLEYFIIEHGKMWDEILEILLSKVKKGVEVRIIYDDMGCFLRLPSKYGKILQQYGIRVAKFNPFVPFFSVEQNNRDHRKIAVIDGKVAFTGGINLADEYIGAVERFGKWADNAVMVEGDAAWSFTLMFLQMWDIIHRGSDEDLLRFLPTGISPLERLEEKRQDGREGESSLLAPVSPSSKLILPYADSPLDTENIGALVYMDIIQSAKRYVYITTPYLIIDDQMLSTLTYAAKSGVDVRIITPHKWDKRLVHMATRSYYRTLWENGVKIYEYTPGFMHAKTIVADDELAVVGSVNFDYRSLYLHFECGAYLYGTDTVDAVKDAFLAYMDASAEITPRPPRRNAFARLCRAVLRLLAPLM
ncbi:MAG: cardiolipin synthase [Ruminococcaceae bacterium]|nr:cardiolipin synthase [Oscillospiraceae bacterium]